MWSSGRGGRVLTGRTGLWGFSNQDLSQIHVGSSPVGEDVEGLKNLAVYLTSVVPRRRRSSLARWQSDEGRRNARCLESTKLRNLDVHHGSHEEYENLRSHDKGGCGPVCRL